MTYFHNNLPT